MSPSATSNERAHAANGVPTMTNGFTNGLNTTLEKTVGKGFDSIESTIEAFARGDFVIVLDSTSRENEGDLIISSAHLTTEKMAFMIRHTSGYICAPVTTAIADRLNLPLMVLDNADPNRTAYCVSIDAVHESTRTGISAHDRALTCRTMADEKAVPASFRRPGHILPLRAREGGVRARFGHTEAAVELCRLAGHVEAATICEMIIDGDESGAGVAELNGGRMMRRDDCLEFGRRWGLKVCTIEDLVRYVEEKEGRLDVEGVDY